MVSFELIASSGLAGFEDNESSTHIIQGKKGNKDTPKCPACNPTNQQFIRHTYTTTPFFLFTVVLRCIKDKPTKKMLQ